MNPTLGPPSLTFLDQCDEASSNVGSFAPEYERDDRKQFGSSEGVSKLRVPPLLYQPPQPV